MTKSHFRLNPRSPTSHTVEYSKDHHFRTKGHRNTLEISIRNNLGKLFNSLHIRDHKGNGNGYEVKIKIEFHQNISLIELN